MQFRETTKEDFEYTANHSISRGLSKYQPECIEFLYTLEHEGKPLCVGGFRLLNLTTAWAWVDLTESARGHIITCYRAIKEWTDIFVKEHNIRRLQAYIESDFPEGIRMAQHLGFRKESIMEKFMDGKDAFMYVRII